eukprot:PhM_4_TR8117/c0_g1_i1/m.66216
MSTTSRTSTPRDTSPATKSASTTSAKKATPDSRRAAAATTVPVAEVTRMPSLSATTTLREDLGEHLSDAQQRVAALATEMPGSQAHKILLEARQREISSRGVAAQAYGSYYPDATVTLLNHELQETFQQMLKYRNKSEALEAEVARLRRDYAALADVVKGHEKVIFTLRGQVADYAERDQELMAAGAVVSRRLGVEDVVSPKSMSTPAATHSHLFPLANRNLVGTVAPPTTTTTTTTTPAAPSAPQYIEFSPVPERPTTVELGPNASAPILDASSSPPAEPGSTRRMQALGDYTDQMRALRYHYSRTARYLDGPGGDGSTPSASPQRAETVKSEQ